MRVQVNGVEWTLPADATVARVVADLHRGPDPRGVAVAVDGEVVRRADWATADLHDGARVEVLGAIGGGR